ncbi:hypothetical protein [Gryllotalpicola koreensis]|uniref:Septum formation-related domain-containing protein n=1 Tax=Gryllotalpicola koreensis TaxID=993086 RepID=A0ABP7ZPH9_9MICO
MSPDDKLVAPPRDDAIRGVLLETLEAAPAARQRRTRRRWAVWGSVGVLVAASAGVGAGVVVKARSVSDTSLVHCLSSAHKGIGGKYPDSSATLAQASGTPRVTDAVALCTQMWRQGVFEPGFDPTASSNPPGKVPEHLTVCVMKDSSAAVVPGDGRDLCQSIGLAPLKG